MRKVRLSAKMGVGFGIVILALALVGGIALYSVVGVNTSVQDLSGVHLPLTHFGDRLRFGAQRAGKGPGPIRGVQG